MVDNDIMNGFIILMTQFFLGSYVLMLTEFREPVRVWKLLWVAIVVTIVGANVIAIMFFGFWKYYTKFVVFTVTLPYTLTTILCSRHKGLRVAFNVCTCLWLGCIGNANAVLAQELMPDVIWIHIAVRGMTYLALYIFVRFFEPYYKRMLYLLNFGWGTLCVIPFASFLLITFVGNHCLPDAPFTAAAIIYGITLVCTFAYVIMYLFFKRVLRENVLKNRAGLLDMQIAALEDQARNRHETGEKIRLRRHDMRHQWATVSALLEQGDRQAVLSYIDNVREQLEELVPAAKGESRES